MRPLFIGIRLERNRVPSPRFVHPGCTATTNRIQVGEMLEDQLKRTDMRQRDATERHRLRRDAEARRFSLPSTQAADKLIRYETHIDRQLYHAMDELERLQRLRQGEKVPPPLNVNLGREG